MRSKISIVIPTLWAYRGFPHYIAEISDQEIIKEVIIIDNNTARNPGLSHSKIRVIAQSNNIYVNPAWNLGASLATGSFLCFLNDDLAVRPETFNYVAELLLADNNQEFGLVGIDFSQPGGILGYRRVEERNSGNFGSMMFLRKKDFRPIPSMLKIWHGDDYLLLKTLLKGKQVICVQGCGHSPDVSSVSVNTQKEEISRILDSDTFLWSVFISRMMRIRYQPMQTIKKTIKILWQKFT